MATKQYMGARMAKGANLALLPGGFEEATVYKRNAFRIYIRKRTGFIVYALRYGYKLYPYVRPPRFLHTSCHILSYMPTYLPLSRTFCFGEERTYFTCGLDFLTPFCLWLNQYKIPTVCAVGTFGLMPSPNQHLVTVIGPPLQLPKIEKPTAEDVAKYHQLYVRSLLALFDKHKAKYGAADKQLEVF